MHRRTLLRLAAISGLAASRAARLLASANTPQPRIPVPVHTVLLVTKCHLDVGFSMTQAKVLRQYFDLYFPAAITTAAQLRQFGPDRYTWTTGSWLLYEYLEQASQAQRRAMEKAIEAGDIAWHALPFSWQTEMLDRSMIEGALSFSATLDRRFGRKTIGAKMTDVPGHSRGIVAPLQAAGVRLLDIGVNAASTPPDVPDIFLWKDPEGNSLGVMYHRHDYGSVLEIPGTGVAVDVEVRGDNSGPHTLAEISAIYAKLRAQFPGAAIKAANLNEVAAAVDQIRDTLPVVTGEIGDTWIYGCASDPCKVSRYREMARLRKAWLTRGAFTSGDSTDRNLLRSLLLAVEHTWGTDTKTYLDNNHYRPADLAKVLGDPGYTVMEVSWKEKRDDIESALLSLPPGLKREADLDLQKLNPARPSTVGMVSHNSSQPFKTRHFDIAIDPATGAIVQLRNRTSGVDWASPQQPLALLTYQTLSAEIYAAYIKRYITIQTDWAPRDFGKPGIENFHAVSQEWHPRVVSSHTASTPDEDRLLLELAFDDAEAAATGNLAWPRQIFVEARMPVHHARIDLRVTTLGKAANRLPEAIWMTFAPAHVPPQSWKLQKVDQMVSPIDVVRGGGRSMHAVTEIVRCTAANGSPFEIHTLDAPVVALGERSPLGFSFDPPNLSSGAHFSLYNNAWGTNYPQWCGGDWSYRFQILA